MVRILLSLLALPLLFVQLKPAQRPSVLVPVTGPKVLFFEPTQVERDSIIRVDGMEMAQLFDDFDYNAARASGFVKARGIPVQVTSNPELMVRLETGVIRKFERKFFADVVGVLLTDGVQEPRLLPGMLTEEELIAEFTSFFRLQ